MGIVKIEAEELGNPSVVEDIIAWNEYDINSNMMNAADGFSIGVTPTPKLRKFFKAPGHNCRIYLDGQLQMSGIVDTVQKQSSGDSISLTLTGRDYGGLLVDDTPPMITYFNRSAKQLIEVLIQNHSDYISSIVTDNAANRYILTGKSKKVGKKSPVYRGINQERSWATRTKPGDRIWDVISKMAQEIGCHVWMSADGKLVIARPQYKISPDAYGEGLYQKTDKAGDIVSSNCSVQWDPSIADRYAYWNITGQGTPKANSQGKNLTDHYNVTNDPGPGFFTNGIVNRLYKQNNASMKSVKDKAFLRRAARTRMEQTIVDSYDMSVTVNGHRPFAGGPLYTVDTTINVRFDTWGVSGVHYIVGRTFRHDTSNGETTELELIPIDIWLAKDHDAISDGAYLDAMKKVVTW